MSFKTLGKRALASTFAGLLVVQLLGGMAQLSATSIGPEIDSLTNDGQLSSGGQNGVMPYGYGVQLSADGRYVAFTSTAQNFGLGGLAPQGLSSAFGVDIYVHDRQTNHTVLASLDQNGQPLRNIFNFALSDNGRYVAETTIPTDGVVYVRDMTTGITQTHPSPDLISNNVFIWVSDTGVASLLFPDGHGTTLSADGRYEIRYDTAVTGTPMLYRLDTQTGQILRADVASNSSPLSPGALDLAQGVGWPNLVKISQDGQKVLFKKLDAGPYQEWTRDEVYVHDFTTGTTRLVSRNAAGQAADTGAYDSDLNGDGTTAAFATAATNFGYNSALGQVYTVSTALADNPDVTAPDIYSSTFTADPKLTTQPSALQVYAADNEAGVAGGEYFVGDTDPGQDNATALTWDGNNLVAPFDTSLLPGVYQVHFRVYDAANNWSSLQSTSLTVIPPDTTPPTIGTFSWSLNPKPVAQSSTLTVPASDDSGVAAGEYYIGDTDPGQGNATPMILGGGALSTTFSTGLPSGVYKITVRAKDTRGNWSAPVSDFLVVYDPSGANVTGKKTVVPSLVNNDILPGLNDSAQTDKAQFGFTVDYTNQGVISNLSDLQFSYSTGTRCNNPARATNCHSLSLNATNINWLITDSDNQSEGVFQGTATLIVDGVTTANPFRVMAVDGTRLSPTAADHFALLIFGPGANPNTATPIYKVSDVVLRGNITVTPPVSLPT